MNNGNDGDAKWATLLARAGIAFTQRSTGVYIILCPFHKERTPSMHMWPKSGRYHCHGCHSGGTIEEFAAKMGLPTAYLRAYREDPRQLKFL